MQNSKRILFVTISEKGHINPMIGVAQQLQRRGFELAFFSQADISEQLIRAGLKVPTFFDNAAKSEGQEFVSKGKDFALKIQDKVWLRNWIKTLVIDSVPQQVPVLEKAVIEFNPDVIVSDPMVYAAAIVATQRDIPWVGISSSLNPITPQHWACELTETLDLYARERESLFENIIPNPAFRVSDLISPWLNIVFSTEAYIPREWSNNDFSFYVGQSYMEGARGDEQEFPFHLLRKDSKKVYMSLGSQVFYHPQLFDQVQQALSGLNIQLIFAINDLMHTSFVDALHENVLAVPYAPQLELLPHVDLMISHGGANSVMECLANGKPIALLPICNDQMLQAKFVLSTKVGRVMKVHNGSVENYREQLLALLAEDAEERSNAAMIGRSFSRHKGPVEAADLVASLLTDKKPLMPNTKQVI